MKYFFKIYYLLIIFITIGCKSNQEQKPINIEGNWYTYNFSSQLIDSSDKISQFTYEEVFINANKIFSCNYYVGLTSPADYKMNGILYLFRLEYMIVTIN